MTMDCQTARELLDASRPDRRDWREPELSAAAEHAGDCEACARVTENRDRFDRQLVIAMRDVQVPEGLLQRLHAALEAPAQTEPAPQDADVPRRRRAQLWTALSAATLLLAAGLWWALQPGVPPLTLDGVYSQLNAQFPVTGEAIDLSARPAFDGGFDAAVEDSLWTDLVASAPAGINLDDDPAHEAAVYRFDTGRVSGLLVVTSRSDWREPPPESAPARANSRYVPRPQVAWTSGDKVYVCVLERGSLDALTRQLYGSAA